MNTDEHEHKYLEEQQAMKDMDDWLEKTVKRMNKPKKKMKRTATCPKTPPLGGRGKKEFTGAETWSHFIIEGHCGYGWRDYKEDLREEEKLKPPEFCHQGKHMKEHCSGCTFFSWTPSMISKEKKNKIYKFIEEVMK